MLRLPTAGPRWLDLPQGVRLLHRPAAGSDIAAAAPWAKARAADLLGRLGAATAPGDEAAQKRLAALEWGFFVIALGRLTIEAWEGVEDALSPETVEALLTMPDMAMPFFDAVMGLQTAVAAEGNGSAPAPNGTTAGAPDTAPCAPAPGATAATDAAANTTTPPGAP